MEIKKRNSALVSIFLCSIVVVSVKGWRPFRVTLKTVTTESFNNLTLINATLNPTGGINVLVEILDVLHHPFAYTQIFADSGSGHYDFEIMNRTVNLCEFFRTKHYEPLLQMIYKIFVESGPWPTSCPIRKTRFSIKNLFIDADKLPPYLPERRAYVSLKFANKKDGIMGDLNAITVFFEVESTSTRRLKKTR